MTIALPKVVPLEPFGCEVVGVDFSRDLHPDIAAAVRRAWAEHGIAVFREAIHDDDAHIRALVQVIQTNLSGWTA